MTEQLLEHLDDVIVGMKIVVEQDHVIQGLEFLFRLLSRVQEERWSWGASSRAVFIVALVFATCAVVVEHLLRWMKAWGRNGFDGIESLCERRAGFRAPVKRSENHNCQYTQFAYAA